MAVENAAVAVGNTTLTQETVHQDCWRSWTQHIVEISTKIISMSGRFYYNSLVILKKIGKTMC